MNGFPGGQALYEGLQKQQESRTERASIQKCLHRKLVFNNPIECLRQKRIKNCKSLYEQEAYLVPFSKVRKHLLASTRSSSQKHTMYVHLEFCTIAEVVKVLGRILPKHSNLRGLYLFFNEEITFDSWRKIGKLISRFSHLNSLIVNFCMKKPIMKDIELKKMYWRISMIPGLTSLGVGATQHESNFLQSGFTRAAFIPNNSNKTEGLLSKLLSRLKKLKALDFKAMGLDSLTDAGIVVSAKALSVLQTMQDVCVKIYDCRRVTNQGISTYLGYLQASPHLEKLTVAFKISEEDRIDWQNLPVLHPIWTNKKLSYASLDIKFTSLCPPKALDAVITGIEKINCLGKLVLSFHGTDWDAIKEIEKLVLICSKMLSLTELTIRFINCPTLDYMTANNMIYGFNSCPNLKKADLEFLSCFKKIEGSTTEIEAPLVSCPNLKDLSLSFVDCTELQERQVDRIVELLIHCENLEALILQVNWCKSFSDEHYRKLTKAISAMPFLQRMTLGFEGNNVTAASAPRFGKMIQSLPLLRSLELKYSYFPELADERLPIIAKWISGLKYLETFKLNMKGCKYTTDEGVIALCNNLKGLNKLGVIMLFWNSTKLRELSKILASQLAVNLPNLYCIELHAMKPNGQTSKVCIRLTS